MNESKHVLDGLISTVQMGQLGIRAVMDYAVRVELKNALQSQLAEYDKVETQAHELAEARGWELKEVNPAIRSMAAWMSRMRLSFGRPDSKIAAMMIQGNTRGMIKGLKNEHQYSGKDSSVRILSQKLLDCEQANIRQMQAFL